MSRLTAEQKENVKVLCELMEQDIDAVIGDRIDWHEFAYYLDHLNTVGILDIFGRTFRSFTSYRMNPMDILTWATHKMNNVWGSCSEKAVEELYRCGFEKVGMHNLYMSDIWQHKETGILGRFGFELDNLGRKVFSLSPVKAENVDFEHVYVEQKHWQ